MAHLGIVVRKDPRATKDRLDKKDQMVQLVNPVKLVILEVKVIQGFKALLDHLALSVLTVRIVGWGGGGMHPSSCPISQIPEIFKNFSMLLFTG